MNGVGELGPVDGVQVDAQLRHRAGGEIVDRGDATRDAEEGVAGEQPGASEEVLDVLVGGDRVDGHGGHHGLREGLEHALLAQEGLDPRELGVEDRGCEAVEDVSGELDAEEGVGCGDVERGVGVATQRVGEIDVEANRDVDAVTVGVPTEGLGGARAATGELEAPLARGNAQLADLEVDRLGRRGEESHGLAARVLGVGGGGLDDAAKTGELGLEGGDALAVEHVGGVVRGLLDVADEIDGGGQEAGRLDRHVGEAVLGVDLCPEEAFRSLDRGELANGDAVGDGRGDLADSRAEARGVRGGQLTPQSLHIGRGGASVEGEGLILAIGQVEDVCGVSHGGHSWLGRGVLALIGTFSPVGGASGGGLGPVMASAMLPPTARLRAV